MHIWLPFQAVWWRHARPSSFRSIISWLLCAKGLLAAAVIHSSWSYFWQWKYRQSCQSLASNVDYNTNLVSLTFGRPIFSFTAKDKWASFCFRCLLLHWIIIITMIANTGLHTLHHLSIPNPFHKSFLLKCYTFFIDWTTCLLLDQSFFARF